MIIAWKHEEIVIATSDCFCKANHRLSKLRMTAQIGVSTILVRVLIQYCV